MRQNSTVSLRRRQRYELGKLKFQVIAYFIDRFSAELVNFIKCHVLAMVLRPYRIYSASTVYACPYIVILRCNSGYQFVCFLC